MTIDPKDTEYQAFLASSAEVPGELVTAIRSRVHSDLQPAAGKVYLKLAAIHVLTLTLTLTYCPQFGIGFTSANPVMDYFMRWGHSTCMLVCGLTALGGTSLVSAALLSRPELSRLRQSSGLPIILLALGTLLFFAQLSGAVTLYQGSFWLLGAVMGGTLLLEVASRSRLAMLAN